MRRSRLPLFALAFLGAVLASCGGGGGGGGGGDDGGGTTPGGPSITRVEPAGGPATGETPITITGTGFGSGAIATIGGAPATSVTVASDTSITCTTPPGTAGAADVTVTQDGDSATLRGGFTYASSPVMTSMWPPSGPRFGGTDVTITGFGFMASGAGTTTVTFGSTAATNVTVQNDTTITCTAPAGAVGVVQVAVTNAQGAADPTLAYNYFVPLLAAEAGLGPVWMLYALDPTIPLPEPIPVGDIGFGVLGMDFDPSGTLYAVTDPGTTNGSAQLATINPVTGAGTLIGATNDATGTNHVLPDVSFSGTTLYGTDGLLLNLVSVNLGTGLVTVVNTNPFPGTGSAFAADATVPTPLVYYMTADNGPLYGVTVAALPPAPAFAPSAFNLNGFTLAPGSIRSASYHRGVLYGLDAVTGPGTRRLVTINVTNGLVQALTVPLSTSLSAIASQTR